jgi:hypothetical protein
MAAAGESDGAWHGGHDGGQGAVIMNFGPGLRGLTRRLLLLVASL